MITYAPLRYKRTIFAAIGILFIGGAVCPLSRNVKAQEGQLSSDGSAVRSVRPTAPKKSAVHLYFADRDSYYLMSEQRNVFHAGDAVDHARSIVEALIKGPQKSLVRTIAAGTELRAVYIIPNGTCYVDLSQTVGKGHPGGCNSELLTIFSVVNSLILNVPEIKRVKLLIDGKEVQTLAGHIDLAFPLEANMLLIR